MSAKKLSIIVPVYNEERTVSLILEKLMAVELINDIKKEIIVVNDCSEDSSEALVRAFIDDHSELDLNLLSHESNSGKGAALHTGISSSTGDFIVIQDADLEYDPQEFNKLLELLMDGSADVVYGSRFSGSQAHRAMFFGHTFGNKALTFFSNVCTNLNLTDMETCYKMFRSEILKGLKLRETGYGFEPEVTAKIARIPEIRIFEVGVSYYGRSYDDGKKIGWRDGIRAIYCIVKYGLFRRN